MEQNVQIFTTFPTKSDADKISDTILKDKLAACAQIIGPIVSKYWWLNKIETSEEWLCILKSTEKNYKSIETQVVSLSILTIMRFVNSINSSRWFSITSIMILRSRS